MRIKTIETKQFKTVQELLNNLPIDEKLNKAKIKLSGCTITDNKVIDIKIFLN